MGKSARLKSKNKRKLEKIARKRARKAIWDAAIKAGSNRKDKNRAKSLRKTAAMKPTVHGAYDCGNLACKKCYNTNADKQSLALADEYRKASLQSLVYNT